MRTARRLRLVETETTRLGTDVMEQQAIASESQKEGIVKVAFCTQDMEHLDSHFGWAKNIVIYDVEKDGHKLSEAIQFDGEMFEDGNEDKLVPKIEAVEDCHILYVSAIGAAAAARVVAKRIHPIKVEDNPRIEDLLAQLKETINGTPPPWLRKVLRGNEERKLNFEEDDED